MQNEINQAAEGGYRVVAASRTEGSEVVVVLERTDASYRLVATTRTGTLQKELVEGAEAGYRVVTSAVTAARNPSALFFMRESSPGLRSFPPLTPRSTYVEQPAAGFVQTSYKEPSTY